VGIYCIILYNIIYSSTGSVIAIYDVNLGVYDIMRKEGRKEGAEHNQTTRKKNSSSSFPAKLKSVPVYGKVNLFFLPFLHQVDPVRTFQPQHLSLVVVIWLGGFDI